MLWLYPEGTRNKERETKLLPFRRGAFVVAVTAQLPIYPLICSPHYFLDEKKFRFQNNGELVRKCLLSRYTCGGILPTHVDNNNNNNKKIAYFKYKTQ